MTKHKYLLFFGENYYPFGGFTDFKSSSNSIEELKNFFQKNSESLDDKWAQIVDLNTLKIIEKYNDGGYENHKYIDPGWFLEDDEDD